MKINTTTRILCAIAAVAFLPLIANAEKKSKSKEVRAGKAVPTWYRIQAGKEVKTVKTSVVTTNWKRLKSGGVKGVASFKSEGEEVDMGTGGTITITPLGNGAEPMRYSESSSGSIVSGAVKGKGSITIISTTTTDSKGNAKTRTVQNDSSTGTTTTTITTTTSDGEVSTDIFIDTDE